MPAPVDGVLVLAPRTPAAVDVVALDVVEVAGVAVVVLDPGVLLVVLVVPGVVVVVLVVVRDDVLLVDDDAVVLDVVVVPAALQSYDPLFVLSPANVPLALFTWTRHEL